jgi:hypothetical protein
MLKETCVVAARCPTGDKSVLTEDEVIHNILCGPIINQCVYKPSQFLKLNSFFYLKNCHAESESDGQPGSSIVAAGLLHGSGPCFFFWLDG